MTTTLDIDTLRSLVAIADTKSFSRAAERLGRTQSAISLRIARLEVLVGHPVIERGRGRMLRLTARGETLVAHARQIIELNERAVASVRQPGSGARIRIGMPADFLERVANDPRASNYDSTKPTGLYIYAPTSAELNDAFSNIASQILHLAR